MEEDGSSNKAATSSVSFTVKKKTTKLKPVQLEHAETKEFVFSLEGRQIERYYMQIRDSIVDI